MKKEQIKQLPDNILEKLIRECSVCNHKWMPKIRIDGSVVFTRTCPNPNCNSSKWNE